MHSKTDYNEIKVDPDRRSSSHGSLSFSCAIPRQVPEGCSDRGYPWILYETKFIEDNISKFLYII